MSVLTLSAYKKTKELVCTSFLLVVCDQHVPVRAILAQQLLRDVLDAEWRQAVQARTFEICKHDENLRMHKNTVAIFEVNQGCPVLQPVAAVHWRGKPQARKGVSMHDHMTGANPFEIFQVAGNEFRA